MEYSRCCGELSWPSTSFNSATAVKPWNTESVRALANDIQSLQFGHGGEAVEYADSHRRLDALPGGFNSATAVKPWNTLGGLGEQVLPHGASIRPRR